MVVGFRGYETVGRFRLKNLTSVQKRHQLNINLLFRLSICKYDRNMIEKW